MSSILKNFFLSSKFLNFNKFYQNSIKMMNKMMNNKIFFQVQKIIEYQRISFLVF